MSASLLRRGKELLNNDLKGNAKVKRKWQTPSSPTVMDLVSTKRQGVTKQLKRLQGRLGARKSRATVKDKRIKSAVEEFRKKQKSHLRANLKYCTETSRKAKDSDTLKKRKAAFPHFFIYLEPQSRNRPERTAKKVKEPVSLFTEEEFQQFQKGYFGRTVESKK